MYERNIWEWMIRASIQYKSVVIYYQRWFYIAAPIFVDLVLVAGSCMNVCSYALSMSCTRRCRENLENCVKVLLCGRERERRHQSRGQHGTHDWCCWHAATFPFFSLDIKKTSKTCLDGEQKPGKAFLLAWA